MKDLRPGSRFDLHLHTSASDGRYDAEEVLRRCARAGLDVIAITDHDFAANIEPGARTVEGRSLFVVPGAEVSGMHDGREYHLLVYFPRGAPAAFRDFCRSQCERRVDRYNQALRSLGLDTECVSENADERALTRFHLAQKLVELGKVRDTNQAFVRFLGDAHDTVPKLTFPFVEAIRMARALGGITSWAHPPPKALEKYLETFVAAGLQGLEGIRPMMSSEDRRRFRKLARHHGLFITGGSDWHGWKEADPGLFRVHASEIRDFVDVLVAA